MEVGKALMAAERQRSPPVHREREDCISLPDSVMVVISWLLDLHDAYDDDNNNDDDTDDYQSRKSNSGSSYEDINNGSQNTYNQLAYTKCWLLIII